MKQMFMVILILATMVVAFAELGPNAGTPAIQQEIVSQQIVLRQYICRGDKAGIARVQKKISSLNERLTALEGKVSVHGKILHDHEDRIVYLEENRKDYLTEAKADGFYQPIVASNPPAPAPVADTSTPPPAVQDPGTTDSTGNSANQQAKPAQEKSMLDNFLVWLGLNWGWFIPIGIIVCVAVYFLRVTLTDFLEDLFRSWDTRTFGGGSTSVFKASGRVGRTRWSWEEKKNTP
jgi:hypothetical protein